MTISGYSSAIVDTMLGWLKGFANWVLRLFNLAGSASASPLLWLSRNWLKLLVVLMLIGVAADIMVWLVRWRPHWVWFRKERVIVKDESFFNEADLAEPLDLDDEFLEKNWQERDYVVASTVVRRPPDAPRRAAPAKGTKRPSGARPSTVVKRRGAGESASARASFRRGERRRKPGAPVRPVHDAAAEEKARRIRSEREADLFGLDGNRPDVTDFYEDEVFNVSNLPSADDYPTEDKA